MRRHSQTARPRPTVAVFALAAGALLLLTSDRHARAGEVAGPAVAEAREWLMGTIAEVRVLAIDRPERARAAVDAAFGELRAVDHLMAVQRPESDVSRMNRDAARGATAVDPRVIDVLRAAQAASRLTNGAFDPTVLPVVAAWGFLEGPARRPATPPRRPAGWRNVEIDVARGTVSYRAPDVGVDLGGIAKGYALDRARGLLLRHGVRSAWLDLGGNVATIGTPPGEPAWRVGVRDPRREGALLGVIQIGEASVSTSSDAERFVADAAGRAGHVIDPRTGAPATALVAATIVTASATVADALSTAAIVVGERRVRPMLARVAGGAVLVPSGGGDDRLIVTPGLVFEPWQGS